MPDLNLAIAGTMPVADDKMIGKTVHHVPYASVVDVKNPGISFPCATVVHDDVFPTATPHRRMINRGTGRRTQVIISAVSATSAKEPAEEAAGGGSRSRFDPL